MEPGSLRRLLPALSDPSKRDSSHDPPLRLTKRKRLNVTKVACETCRLKKTGCDGKKPVCMPCQKRGSECVYRTVADESLSSTLRSEVQSLKQNVVVLEQLVDLLRDMPERAAAAALEAIRASQSADPTILLQSATSTVLCVGPSEHTSAKGILQKVYSDMELELVVQHPNAYPLVNQSESGLLAPFSQLQPTKKTKSEASTTSEYDSSIPNTPSVISSHESNQTFSTDAETLPLSNPAGSIDSPASSVHFLNMGPSPPRKYRDIRLNKLDISFWSAVSVTNEDAASAISLYLETDHPLLGLFDTELFIGDLVDCKIRFCSPFLVSSFLSLAYQSCTSRSKIASDNSNLFLDEAKRLWQAESSSDSLLNLSGLMFLFLSMGCRGQPSGSVYLDLARDMAARMKLFGVPDRLNSDSDQFKYLFEDQQRMTAHVAWGVFSSITLNTVLYPFSKIIEYPPVLPIPGVDSNDGFPTSPKQRKLASDGQAGQTFASFCQLWVIVNKIQTVYHGNNGASNATRAFSLTRYNELLALAASLHQETSSGIHGSADVVVFHMWFHMVILDLFRPLINDEKKQRSFSSFMDNVTSPEAIFAASLAQLKALVLSHIRRHPAAAYSIWWNPALIYVANAVLNNRDDPHWRFYFLVCIGAYQKLSACFPVVHDVVQSLLAMAISKDAMSDVEAKHIMEQVHKKPRGGRKDVHVKGGYVVDLELALKDSEAALAQNLVARFEEALVLAAYTTGVFPEH